MTDSERVEYETTVTEWAALAAQWRHRALEAEAKLIELFGEDDLETDQ